MFGGNVPGAGAASARFDAYTIIARAIWRDAYRRRRVRVRAAFLAAVERRAGPLVLAALRAAAVRDEAERREAARRDCFDSDPRETVPCGSRLRARDTARESRGRRRGVRLPWPAS